MSLSIGSHCFQPLSVQESVGERPSYMLNTKMNLVIDEHYSHNWLLRKDTYFLAGTLHICMAITCCL